MADIADLAQEHIEKHAPLDPGVRFCDANCCRDWEHEQERARVNGG